MVKRFRSEESKASVLNKTLQFGSHTTFIRRGQSVVEAVPSQLMSEQSLFRYDKTARYKRATGV